ncbi:MAG: mycofactocin precursor [Actinomycetia bacterium]|nr:mycofactocin precursor [Actinomycetes bacterium]
MNLHNTAAVDRDPTAAIGDDTATGKADEERTVEDESMVTEELLVEEVSIDGMCGVY